MRTRLNWPLALAALVFAVSCSGGGCGGCAAMEPIPGGFPASQRARNAVQVRVTDGALAALSADPARLVMGVLNGPLAFNVPASCGGSPEVCCPGGTPLTTCGPLTIDLAKQPGDDARLVLAPIEGQRQLRVTMRARLKTTMDIPVKYSGISCGVAIDTAAGSNPDVEVIAPVTFEQDPTAGTTRLVVGDITINRLENADLKLRGSFACTVAGFGVGFFIGTLKQTFADQIKSTVQDQTCKACMSGDVSECGSFATACTNTVCMEGTQCLQELGLEGRIHGSALFGSLSPGTTGAFDLYEVAGGYADSNTNGLALGLLGGMVPSGAPRDRCGPMATAPALATIQPSIFFQGNTRPDTGAAYDIGFGVHVSQLAQFAYAAYDGGFLCLTVSARTVAQLTTGTLSLVAQSLGNLNENTAPMAVGLRPQSPPVITLGTNTFTTDASGNSVVADPLLTLSFPRMELDFFATVDHQYVRAFTVVADVTLPLGMQTTAAGQLAPVLGDVAAAFTNLSVKNSEAVTESPEQIAAVLPSLLQVVVPSLTGALGSFALPSFGGLALDVKAITSVPQLVGGTDHSYLALYADLVPAPLARPVTTTARVVSTRLPEPAAAADPRLWRGAVPPAVTLALGGANVPAGAALEWSYRLDEGLWSAWSPSPTQTVTGAGLWLAVDHVVEVRARERGVPASMDPLPVRVAFAIPTAELALARAGGVRPFHGAPVPGGCACDAGGRPGASPLLALLLGLLVVGRKRLRRVRARLGTLMTALVIALVPGCSCGSDAASTCGDTACKPGDVAHGGFGRFTSIAADGSRVLVATYDQDLGDLVVVDATDPAAPHPVAVDGLPPGVTPTHDPKGYRGGIEGAGPNVGAWTAIGIQDGLARVAYQDRDAFALKYAVESAPGVWTSYVVDEDGASDGVEIGAYASLAFDSNGHAAIAYVAEHVTSATGQLVTELRLARAASRSPGANDWTTTVITSGAGTCADRCGTGTACVAGTAGESCAAVTADCTVACAATDVCIAGTCTKPIADPMLETIGSGPGLFASLVVLPDGRLAVAFYDMPGHALALAVESAAASSTFTITPLDAPATGDRGLFASAAVDAAGVVHVAYQDAITDELLYTTYSSATAAVGTPEVVDDGVRAGDRTHPVGAGASIYLTAGGPAIAYQDGLTADVDVATRTGSTWTHAAVAATPLLDGFHIATTTAHGAPYLAWDQLDPAKSPPNTLHVETQ